MTNAKDRSELFQQLGIITTAAAQGGFIDSLERYIASASELARGTSAESWDSPPCSPPTRNIRELISLVETLRLPRLKSDPTATNKNWSGNKESLLAALKAGESIFSIGLVKKCLEGAPEFSRHPIESDQQQILDCVIAEMTKESALKHTERTHRLRHLIDNIQKFIDEAKFDSGILSFDDIKVILASCASSMTNSEVFYRLDTRVRHLLIDEFQDTSVPQWSVLYQLVGEIVATNNGERSFLCVGDEKQSIYDWRGGTPELFNQIESTWEINAQALTQSYRSAAPIMDFTTKMMAAFPLTPLLTGFETTAQCWSERANTHSTALPDRGFVQVVQGGNDKGEEGDVPWYVKKIISQITSIQESAPAASIGILMRRNSTIQVLLAALRDANIPASGEGGTPLTASPINVALIALLRWLEHPTYTIEQFIVAHTPIASALQIPGPGTTVESWHAETRSRLWTLGIGPFLSQVVGKLLDTIPSQELPLVDSLLELAFTYAKAHSSSGILRFLEEAESTSITLESSASVRVMTIHRSKGLEFDAVILGDLESSLFYQPSPRLLVEQSDPFLPATGVWLAPPEPVIGGIPRLARASETQQARLLSGELAVLYVGITRAKRMLCVLLEAEPKSNTVNTLFREALALLPASENLESDSIYSSGDPNWWHGLGLPAEPEVPPSVIVTTPVFQPAPHSVRRGLIKQPPSAHTEEAFSFTGTLESARSSAMEFGTEVHRVLSTIHWMTGSLNFDKLTNQSVASYLERAFSGPAIKDLFIPPMDSDSIELWIERPFMTRINDRVINGIFDRVVITKRESQVASAELIDFKTDDCTAYGIQELSQRYEHQVSTYRIALAQLLGIDIASIRARLVFMGIGTIVDI
jgi:ATP-dependent exoDNAse (exonuclease V) beta subunit